MNLNFNAVSFWLSATAGTYAYTGNIRMAIGAFAIATGVSTLVEIFLK